MEIIFDWNEMNEYHIFYEKKARMYTKQMIEAIFEDSNQILSEGDFKNGEHRYKIIGESIDFKVHIVVFYVREGLIRPITAYPAKGSALKIYEKNKKDSSSRL